MLGVQRDGPVWERRLRIEPHLGDLTSAEGVVVTEFGPVPVSWQVAGGRLDFRLTVPAGITATLAVPLTQPATAFHIDGKPVRPRSQGRCLTVPLTSGSHAGAFPFAPLPPLSPRG